MSLQPNSFISKQHFVGIINSLQAQFEHDRKFNDKICGLFKGIEISGAYDNSILINAIFSLLRESFPKEDCEDCELEHYCYVLNFGKCGDEYESPKQLYDRLVISTYCNTGDFDKPETISVGEDILPITAYRRNQEVMSELHKACADKTFGETASL